MCCRLLRLLIPTALFHPRLCLSQYWLPTTFPHQAAQDKPEESPLFPSFPPNITKSFSQSPSKIQATKSLTQVKCENLLTQALASNFHPTPGFPTTNQNKYLRLQTGLCHTPPGTLTSHRPHLFYCPQLTTLGLRSSLCSKHSHPILCN